MNFRILAVAALSGLAAVGAQAFEGEQNPLPQQPFHSVLPRSAVKTQAMHPLAISNGGTGVQAPTHMSDRATVRAGARAIAPEGAQAYGDFF